MIYCYYNFQFWTHLRTNKFETLIEYNADNIKGLRGQQILIHKDFKLYLDRIDKYANSNNVMLIINQSYRPNDLTLSQTIVEPGKLSNHLAGYAIDFNLKYDGKKYFSNDLKRKNLVKLPSDLQNFINAIRLDNQLRWGGDFNTEDPIHIDFPINLKDKKKWIKYNNQCKKDYTNGIPKWKIWRSK